MNYYNEFKRIMERHTEIALATTFTHQPNVRIVNFYYAVHEQIVYFITLNKKQKTTEFTQNAHIAFTTVPSGSIEHVRVKHAIVQKSRKTILDLKSFFIQKSPYFAQTIAVAGTALDLYEIQFKEAQVVLDIENNGTVLF